MFFKRKKPESEDHENKIIFKLKDGKISVSLEVNPNEDNIASSVGELLYSINSGNLAGPISSMLVDFADLGPQHKVLIDDILAKWLELKKLYDTALDEPYMSPLRVFKHEQ
jgi:hypothetical protein